MNTASNTVNTPDFKARNSLLIKALLGNENPQDNFNIIASQLFEEMTGQTLHRDTDIGNGEDYLYKSGEFECMASLKLHPHVSTWFGWYSNSGHSIKNDDFMLIMLADEKVKLAELLTARFDEFQKPKLSIDLNDKIDFSKTAEELAQEKAAQTPQQSVSCIEQILLNDQPFFQGEDLFVMLQHMTGEAYHIGTDKYDKAEHAEYHEWIESSMGIPLTGRLVFVDARGQDTYYGRVQSLYLGQQKAS